MFKFGLVKNKIRGLFNVCKYTNNHFIYFCEFSLKFSFRKFLLRCMGWFSLKLWEVLCFHNNDKCIDKIHAQKCTLKVIYETGLNAKQILMPIHIGVFFDFCFCFCFFLKFIYFFNTQISTRVLPKDVVDSSCRHWLIFLKELVNQYHVIQVLRQIHKVLSEKFKKKII